MAITSDGGGYTKAPSKPTGNLFEAIRDNNPIWNNTNSQPQGPAAVLGPNVGNVSFDNIAPAPMPTQDYSQAIPYLPSQGSTPMVQTASMASATAPRQSLRPTSSSPVNAAPASAEGLGQNPFLNVSFDDLKSSVLKDSAGWVEGVSDALTPFGIDLKGDAGLDAWEQEAAKKQNREIRTANLFGEPYDMGKKGGEWFDNQLGMVGNNPINDTYARYFAEKGMPLDDVYAVTHKPQLIEEGLTKEKAENRNLSPDIYDGTVEMLDDGTYNNYWKLVADAMTGTQYREYRDKLGMGGREDIDPTQVYSKKNEENEYGFKPFTPDMSTYLNMATRTVTDIPAHLGKAIGSARTEYLTPDYEISYDSKEGRKSVSGKDFDKKAPAFMNTFYYDRQFNPDKFLSAPTDGSAYTTLVNQFKVPDASGQDTYHYGHLVDVSGMPDGNVRFSFSDGSSVDSTKEFFDSVYDGQNVNVTPEVVPLQAASGLVDVNSMGPGKHQAMINESVIPNENGEDTYHYGNLVSVNNGPNGTYSFEFEDGSTVNAPAEFFEQVYDKETNNITVPFDRVFLDDIKGNLDIKSEQDKPTLENADVKYMPDMIMSDGSRLSLDDVERLYLDQTPDNDEERKDKDGKPMLSDDDIGYQFRGLLGIPFLDGVLNNRPTRLGGQEIFKDDDFIPDDLSNITNNAMDWTLGSIPISAGKYLPWIYSASNASRALDSGIDPNTYDIGTDSYGLIAGGYDKDGNLKYGIYDENKDGNKIRNDEKSKNTRFSNAAGNLLVPLTEWMVGPIGEHAIPLEKIADKIPLKSAVGRFLRNELIGAAGEGVEEVLGNIFEEGTQYGSDMFADPVMDKTTGEPVKDQYGHEKRDEDTPVWKRMDNFIKDTAGNANAFAGGALVDANMRLLPRPFGGAISDFRTARKQDQIRRSTGVPLYVDPNDVEETKPNKYAGLLDEDELAVSGGR